MADKKKNASRSRSQSQAALQPRPEKEQTPKSATRAATREERKGQPKQESKSMHRETSSTVTLMVRLRRTRWGRFILDAYYELRHKVTWPTFLEARNMTIAVILMSVAIGAILAAADFGLQDLFTWIVSGHL
jgi:preprotein translocase SecE subunit